MKNGTFNIALVGCGGMAGCYRHRYTQIEGARLALLVDASENVAAEAARELGVVSYGTDFDSCFSPDIDMIDISTPNHMHRVQAVKAFKAGMHVLMQKPLAPSMEDGIAIINAARDAGTTAGMYMSMFDYPLYHDIMDIYAKGLLGEISSIHCRGAHRGGLSIPPGTWRGSKELTGGGSSIQFAVHPINMVQHILNSRVTKVAAFSANKRCPNIGGDDITTAGCELENGIYGTIESSYCAEPNIMAIYGTKGYLRVDNDSILTIAMDSDYKGELVNYSGQGDSVTMNLGTSINELAQKYNKHDQHIAFVKAAMSGSQAPIPLEKGLYDLAVVKAVYLSAQERRFVDVMELLAEQTADSEWPMEVLHT